jgi:hypothetical protein
VTSGSAPAGSTSRDRLLVQWAFDLLDRLVIPRGLRLPGASPGKQKRGTTFVSAPGLPSGPAPGDYSTSPIR